METRGKNILALLLCGAALLILPLLSCIAAGKNPARYFDFPPPVSAAQYTHSPLAAGIGLAFLVVALGSLVLLAFRPNGNTLNFSLSRVPPWSLAGIVLCLASWGVSWQQPPAAGYLGRAAFFGLWFGFILTLNAAVIGFGGTPLLCRNFKRWAALFPASALLWWVFEWLNRSVENWSYPNSVQLPALQFSLFATLSFATVLPALLAVAELLSLRFGASEQTTVRPRGAIFAAGLLGAISLIALDFFPEQLFPFVWISPLAILIALATLFGGSVISYQRLAHWAAAGLICGFFWEFWNYWSYYRWIYHVPYVELWYVFEMPLLGYLGYLPFGAFCGLVIDLMVPAAQDSAAGQGKGAAPEHVAIIMDGNGRWATRHGLIRSAGHQKGIAALRAIVKAARKRNISYLTVYVFSAQNWKRPPSEVQFLMRCLEAYAARELPELVSSGVQVRAMGALELLPTSVQTALAQLERATENKELVFTLAVSYGGREELLSAARGLGCALADGSLRADQLDEASFRSFLYEPDLPDPDLLIRTSGELRLSNFMLWQMAYTEFVFSPVFWPDFNIAEFDRCLHEYNTRSRRYGRLLAKE